MSVGIAERELNRPAAGDEATLFAWTEAVTGGRIRKSSQSAGGNRARSWAIDIERPDGGIEEVFLRYAPPRLPGVEPYTMHREAQVYRAIAGLDIRAPRLIAEHPSIEAVLTDRARGIAELRHLKDPIAKQNIITEVMTDLARLHACPVHDVALDGGVQAERMAGHVAREIAIWRAMYEESARPDPLIELAFSWLDDNLPDPDGRVVLVHGDAGPGNFLFEAGRLTALIDWEFAHLGDPMEDLAWYSMRCVMEPVPDFAASLAAYERAAGAKIDRARILYHRVLVSTRVVVIRHRNVTGEPAHAIVSRALNRRLLVEALSDASGVPAPWPVPIEAPPTPNAPLFAQVLDDLRDVVVPRSTDRQVIAKAKNAAKVLKYLEAWDRLGEPIEAAEHHDLTTLLAGYGLATETLATARHSLLTAIRTRRLNFAEALAYFAGQAMRDAQLASGASGGIATRHYPALPS